MIVDTVVREATGTGTTEQRRRAAVAEAVDEALAGARSGRAVIAIRRFDDGALVVALGGHVDRATVRDIDAVLRDVHRLANRHLVIDLTAARSCHAGLARVLGHARIRCLVVDAAVTVLNLPDELRDEYGHQIGGTVIPGPRAG